MSIIFVFCDLHVLLPGKTLAHGLGLLRASAGTFSRFIDHTTALPCSCITPLPLSQAWQRAVEGDPTSVWQSG